MLEKGITEEEIHEVVSETDLVALLLNHDLGPGLGQDHVPEVSLGNAEVIEVTVETEIVG